MRFLRTVLLYIEKGSGLNKNDVKKAMEKADPLIREEYMTLYEQHIQEGMDLGFQKGVLHERQDVLIKQLSKKFGITEEETSSIESIEDADILEKGIDEILFAETKEQVLKVLQ